MSSNIFTYHTMIRETHLDGFGHVNNAVYLELFEESRWEMITTQGFGLLEVQRLGQGPVILEVNVKFRKELRNREKISIQNELLGMRSKIMTLQQTLLKESGEVSALAVFTIGFMDFKLRRLIEFPKVWLDSVGG